MNVKHATNTNTRRTRVRTNNEQHTMIVTYIRELERQDIQQEWQTEGKPGMDHPQVDHRQPLPNATDYEHSEPEEHGKESELSQRRKPPTQPKRQTKVHTGNRRSKARYVTRRNTNREQLARITDQQTGIIDHRWPRNPSPRVWWNTIIDT